MYTAWWRTGAKGGFAAVSTGELPVNNEEGTTLFMERAIDMDDYDGDDFKKVKEYADRIRKHGALATLGFPTKALWLKTKALMSPGGRMLMSGEDGVQVYALNLGMMEKICNDYRRISKFAKACGFDGVLVHGGHGLTSSSLFHPGPTTGR